VFDLGGTPKYHLAGLEVVKTRNNQEEREKDMIRGITTVKNHLVRTWLEREYFLLIVYPRMPERQLL
jgi:hypothetical protein